MSALLFRHATLLLPDRQLDDGMLRVENGRIAAVGADLSGDGAEVIDLGGDRLAPGLVDLHVHGGAGADFMDGTADAFRRACQAHARHGTTSLLPTSCAAPHEQILAFLECCRRLQAEGTSGARVLGAHFYGPYFAGPARGCHPGEPIRPPEPAEYDRYLAFADAITTATVAPELPGAEAFVRACVARGVRCNAGHSHATFDQTAAAIGWGVRHVDHLFCAMSDRAKLRAGQSFPMRGGLLEATLFFGELTTEVIADGKHLTRDLLLLAHKVKGPGRLALVTDCSRALDLPDGEYWFGPAGTGTRFRRQDGVGVTPDGTALASSVVGLDDCVRTFHRLTGVPLWEAVRMASLTPARIAGWDHEIGSLVVGKRADLIVFDGDLRVRSTYLDGRRVIAVQ
jgi:N-acetylglucosamine-6-phosphate deacetylase